MENLQIKILTMVRYYLPGYKAGGPLRTIANMAKHLGKNFSFWIITSDRDAFDTKRYAHIAINQWNSIENAQVFYVSPNNHNISYFAKIINSTQHDVIYLNSFFDPIFTLKPLLARKLQLLSPHEKIIIAPRGEFSPGALCLRGFKKSAYIKLSRLFGLYNDILWHASSDEEAFHIQRSGINPNNRTAIALNVPDLIDIKPLALTNAPTSPLKIAFISRITPKKNLDYALSVISMSRHKILLNIYGLIDDHKYWMKCESLISHLPKNITAIFHGAIPHEKIGNAFSDNELFFLPTKGENYGHVIHEALFYGLPAIISDQTPWNDMEQERVGWTIPLNSPKKFSEAIDSYINMSLQERISMRERCHNYAKRVALNPKIIMDNRSLFLDAISL